MRNLLSKSLVTLCALLSIISICLYVFNPSGTKTYDPRARIFGTIPYRIPAGSMEPTIKVGDMILANVYAYRSETPRRGDVIVFNFPRDPKQQYIKRVVGLPGETVKIEGSQVYINGRKLEEPFVQHMGSRTRPDNEWTVPDGNLFVLGDNRDNSADSRYWGFIATDSVVGRATYVWYSPKGKTGSIPRLENY